MGYGEAQLEALRETINRSAADVVVAATPADLAGLGGIEKRVVRVTYSYEDAGRLRITDLVDRCLGGLGGLKDVTRRLS